MDKNKLASYIDNTILKPFSPPGDIRCFCEDSLNYTFASVCIHPAYVPLAREVLSGSGIMVCTVVGFPLGTTAWQVKIREAALAIEEGADELDMVINTGILKSGDHRGVEDEIKGIVREAMGKTVKVIIETCFLTDEEKRKACKIVINSGAHFVKTSTGFGTGGATLEDIRLLAKEAAGRIEVKASGGISTLEKALEFIKAGARRIGTSSGIAILEEFESRG